MLAGVLERCMKRRGVRDCDPYDWDKLADAPQSVTTSSSSAGGQSKPQQRIINQPGNTAATTENLCDDPLVASIGLNNQENMHPSDTQVGANQPVQQQQSTLEKLLQAAKGTEHGVDGTDAGAKKGAVAMSNGQALQSSVNNAQDKSPKKRKHEDGTDLEPPPLSQDRDRASRSATGAQEVASPESVVETENSREGAVRPEADGDLTTGFSPLAASASMPAVMIASSLRNVATSHSDPQTPILSAGVQQTTAIGKANSSALNSPLSGGEKGGRGRTNLRRFHSMHTHNQSPGNRGVRIASRDSREIKERDRDLSYTQYAVADDDNVSALQQMTRAGGGNFILCYRVFFYYLLKQFFIFVGLTLASQWKSQFDDSEETDDELQGEHLQSPEHLPALARLGVAMLQQQMYGYGSNPTSPVLQPPTLNFSNHLNELAVESTDNLDSSNHRREQKSTAVVSKPSKMTIAERYGVKNDPDADEEYLLVKGSLLDGLDVEGADTLQIPTR